MSKAIYLSCVLLIFGLSIGQSSAQCPPDPIYDFGHCYDNNEVNVVAFEVCPSMAGTTVTAAICQGDFESGFDDLTVYEGAAGSGTTGTIVLGPVDGDLTGTTITSTIADNCLIFVSNSDASLSCESGSKDSLGVDLDVCPIPIVYDFEYCYGDNEVNNVAFEICGAVGEITMASICKGEFESGFDDLTVYEGAMGSGTTGTIIAGPISGDLAGSVINGTLAGTCLTFVTNSDISNSCADGNSVSLQVNIVVALPVELAQFSGKQMEAHNRLEWKTHSESNTAYYAIERSLNGRTGWSTLDKVIAIGYSISEQQYVYEDTKPTTMAYYRLRIVDFDGQEEESAVISIARSSDLGFQLISLYPVPASNVATLTYQLDKQESISFSLTDMMGQLIQQRSFQADRGVQTLDIDLQTLPAGLYFVRLENSQERLVRRLVKD